jgi:hypothetical protein
MEMETKTETDNYAVPQHDQLVKDYLDGCKSKWDSGVATEIRQAMFSDDTGEAGWMSLNAYVGASQHDKAIINRTFIDITGFALVTLVRRANGEETDGD